MLKFIYHTIFVILVISIINPFIYLFITNELLYEEYEKPQKDLFSREINKVMFADSHGWALTHNKPQLDSILMSNGIYNFSYGSDSYGDILIKLKWLIKNNIKIDTILITVDDHMLTKNSSNIYNTASFSNSNLHKLTYLINPIKFYYYKLIKYFPIFYPSNQKLIQNWIYNILIQKNLIEKNGTSYSKLTYEKRNERINNRLLTFIPKSSSIVNNNLKNLNGILNVSEINNIHVQGIKYPIDPILKAKIDSVINHNPSCLIIKSNIHLAQYDLIDFQSKYSDIKYLNDQDHVNFKGAKSIIDELLNTK